MSDSLKIKREPVDTISSAELSNSTPSDQRVTLEKVVKCADDKRKYELLALFAVELLKSEFVEIDEFFSSLTLLKLLIPPQNLLNANNNVLEKISEILLQYVKILRLSNEFDEVWGGIKDCNKLFQVYKLIHEEGCKYLLPNVKAGEFFNKFLCQLISSCSSVSFFESVVLLYKGTIEEIFSKSKGTNVSTDDVRVIISIMKTLLTITKAFGSPPAPRELLCSVSVIVLKNTKAHLCTLYSYNLLAYLIKDVTDKLVLDKLLNGLTSVQIDQVTSLVKECNSLSNTSTWKFKHQFNTDNTNTTTGGNNNNGDVVGSVKRAISRNDKSEVSNKRRKTQQELPANWYKELMSKFETNRGEGKNTVVDKNAWKWKNDALTNTIKMVEGVESVDLQPVEPQFITLFEGLFKYESAIPVVINSLNLYRVLLNKGNCDLLSGGKPQLLADLLFEKLKESNRKVREACVMALVESVKRCRITVLSESVKKTTLNVSPTCRENLYNFLNCKLVCVLDQEFIQRLHQLLNSVSEYIKSLENDKVPKVRMAHNALIAVLDDFNLIYNNISSTSNSSMMTEVTKPTEATPSETIPKATPVAPVTAEVTSVTKPTETKPIEEADKSNLDCTTTAESSAMSEEFTTSGVPENVPEIELLDSVLMSLLDNLTHIVDGSILETFKKFDSEGSNLVLEDGLRKLSVWVKGNEKLLKSVDYYVVKLISYLYSKFTNVDLLHEFFNQLLNYHLTDEAFNEVVEVIRVHNSLKLLNIVLENDNANTNKLLNPLNAFYYKDSTCLTHFLSILRQYFIQSYAKLPSSVLIKMVNFVVYNVKSKIYPVSRMSLELLSTVSEKSEVVCYLDEHLRNTVLYLKPSDKVKKACKESEARVEKYVSKDLFNCMFKDKSNIKRSCEYWKRFLSKGDEKSDNMLLGKARKDLTSWLTYTMYEMKCEKVVLEIFDIMADYLTLKCDFDEEESLLLLHSFASYSFFGKYQLKAISVFSKLIKLFRNSFDSLDFLFEAVERCKEKWQQLMSEALVRLVRNSTPTEAMVQFVKTKLDSCSSLENSHKKLIYQWINNFTSPILNTVNTVENVVKTVNMVDEVDEVDEVDKVDKVDQVDVMPMDVDPSNLNHSNVNLVDTVDTLDKVTQDTNIRQNTVDKVESVDNVEMNRIETVCEEYEQVVEPVSTTGSASEVQFPIQYNNNFVNVSIQTDEPELEPIPVDTNTSVLDKVGVEQAYEKTKFCNLDKNDSNDKHFFTNNSAEFDNTVDTMDKTVEIEDSGDTSKGLSNKDNDVEVNSNSVANYTVPNNTVEEAGNEKMSDQVILDEDVTNDVESCKSLSKQIISSNSPHPNALRTNSNVLNTVSLDSCHIQSVDNADEDLENNDTTNLESVTADLDDVDEFYEENEVTTISCTSRYNQSSSPNNANNDSISKAVGVKASNRVESDVDNAEASGSDESYPSVVVEYDSDSELACGDEFSLSLVELVLSQCSKVNKICLVSSYKDYKSLSNTLCQEDVSKVCLDSCSEILKYKNVLKYLSVPLVEMTHNAILLMTKRILDSTLARDNNYDTFIEPLILAIEVITQLILVFKSVTTELNENFILQFCNVVTNLLSLPKQLFKNERLYCITSSLVSENGLKQSNYIISKMLMVMVELSMESLKGEVDRLLMAKLRFTKILQMQLLINTSQNNSNNIINTENTCNLVNAVDNNIINSSNEVNGMSEVENEGMNELKSVHLDFIEKLEKFANKSSAHNVEKVIQTSNYIISTI
ncbi:uncharacterized protein TA20875 [Theileria annulata]|uniref:Uncharacterized protein n=1 Tax=Theileria annulata TaxID=5874 RepID=Q4UGY0_THEAN|nr:uncharacterized protein TA20875 [Theileria annulata]CAI73659.1 hypothetical protein TA20875 [Theileria annulata]|eukprot:XP_954336.1 hypothetical protein TA20875 [Theileria annulata]